MNIHSKPPWISINRKYNTSSHTPSSPHPIAHAILNYSMIIIHSNSHQPPAYHPHPPIPTGFSFMRMVQRLSSCCLMGTQQDTIW